MIRLAVFEGEYPEYSAETGSRFGGPEDRIEVRALDGVKNLNVGRLPRWALPPSAEHGGIVWNRLNSPAIAAEEH